MGRELFAKPNQVKAGADEVAYVGTEPEPLENKYQELEPLENKCQEPEPQKKGCFSPAMQSRIRIRYFTVGSKDPDRSQNESDMDSQS